MIDETKIYKNYLFQEMSKCSLDKAIEIFIDNFNLMNGVQIIFTDNEKGYDPVMPFIRDYNIKKGVLSTPFRYNKLYLISQEVGINASFGLNTRIGYLYDVSLDTQMVRYIDNSYRNKNQIDEINELSNIFIRKRKYASYMSAGPYIVESTLFMDEVPENVRDTLINFFDILYNSHMRVSFLSKIRATRHVNRIIGFKKNETFKIPEEILRYRYKMIYLMMLKTFEISIRGKSFNSKVKEILHFANDKLNKLMMAELILALEFFDKGTKIRFFGKMQKGNRNILKDIKNLSWDIYHLRSLEMNMLYVKHKKAKVVIPMLYSRDNRFNEMRDLVRIKMIVLDKTQNNYLPFYENTIVQDKIKELHLEGLFDKQSNIRRYESYSFEEVDKLITKLEQSIENQH